MKIKIKTVNGFMTLSFTSQFHPKPFTSSDCITHALKRCIENTSDCNIGILCVCVLKLLKFEKLQTHF